MAIDTMVAPAYLWVPEHVSSAGVEAAEFADSVGMSLDAEQRLCLDCIYAERPDGRWAAFESGVVASRQNIKTHTFKAVSLADLFLFDAELVVWTAHLFPTSVEAFRDIKVILESFDHLRRRVRKVSEANGEEGIELLSGQRLLFKARSKSGGRGLTGDTVILDEAFALAPSEMGSLLPTLSARPNPHVLYGSSAGKVDSNVLRAVRDRGRAGDDPSLAYLEWCAPVRDCELDGCDHQVGARGCVLDDVESWRLANPAMGRRISVEHIAAERRALPPEEFARERLGWWEEPQHGTAGLPLSMWAACAMPEIDAGEVLALAVDVTPDFAWSTVARACRRAGGGVVIEVLEHQRGTDWVATCVAGAVSRDVPLVVDMGGPASVVAPDLAAAGVEATAASARDVAQACAGLVDGLVRRTVSHRSQPELDAAVRGASRRPLGEAWAWSRKSSAVDISPLVAVTLAAWGARQEPSKPVFAY